MAKMENTFLWKKARGGGQVQFSDILGNATDNASINSLVTDFTNQLNNKVDDSQLTYYMTLATSQTISGAKTFNNSPIFNDGGYPIRILRQNRNASLMSWSNADGGSRIGYIGFGASGNNNFSIVNENSGGGLYLGTATKDINVLQCKISNMIAPSNDNDAVNKKYVDDTFQGKLTAGANITISADNTISASGGGGSVNFVDIGGNATDNASINSLVTNFNTELNTKANESELANYVSLTASENIGGNKTYSGLNTFDNGVKITNLSMEDTKISNVAYATNNNDATNKLFVDNAYSVNVPLSDGGVGAEQTLKGQKINGKQIYVRSLSGTFSVEKGTLFNITANGTLLKYEGTAYKLSGSNIGYGYPAMKITFGTSADIDFIFSSPSGVVSFYKAAAQWTGGAAGFKNSSSQCKMNLMIYYTKGD